MLLTWTELLGFITGAICVWLCVRENVWNWPTGIANNIFYIVVFWRSGLYGDSLLQFIYIAIALYGWWNWLHGGAAHTRLPISRASVREMFLYAVLTALITIALEQLLHRFTNSTVPLWD